MAEEAELRQRKAPAETTPEADTEPAPQAETEPKTKKRSKSKKTLEDDDDDDEYTPWVDILRVISFIIVASCGLSYLVTSGKSYVWGGVRPPLYLQPGWWREQIVRLFPDPPFFFPFNWEKKYNENPFLADLVHSTARSRPHDPRRAVRL